MGRKWGGSRSAWARGGPIAACLVLFCLGAVAMSGATPALAAVSSAEVEHAQVEDLFAAPDGSLVTGVSDDDRYVLVSGSDGLYRYDTTNGERVRVDVYADGTPVGGYVSS